MKIAVIGQSQFAVEVCKLLQLNGHEIVAVFTIPDVNGRPDVLSKFAESHNVKVFKFARWRLKNQIIPEVWKDYESVHADLNVLPYCSQFIPMEVIQAPKFQSIIYHPSLLPKHRGASSINWALIHGDRKTGFSIFWADEGLDTGPILLQRECTVDTNDTVETLYNRFLYPEGIKAMAEAVQMIAAGTAPRIVQPSEGASYEPIVKKETARVDWNQSALSIHNFIRGNDKVPGAWCVMDGQKVTLLGSQMWHKAMPYAFQKVVIEDCAATAIIHSNGLLVAGNDGKLVNITQLVLENGKMVTAAKYGEPPVINPILLENLSEDKERFEPILQKIWSSILGREISDDTDFFKSGGASMDVVRLVEEVKQKCFNIKLTPEDVYMGSTFEEFVICVILKSRTGNSANNTSMINYDRVKLHVNDMDISFPHQVFINNVFSDAHSGRTFKSINPADESVICEVALGGKEDADRAVRAAVEAFENGEWSKISARERGKLMYRLADLMDSHAEELATIESLDSGALYTLALKTHIGMSVDVIRYFAGWCDKIQGSVIPISHARPNKNLTFTKREPIGVCGIVTPWNYPLMMLAWKISACLAAGNTVVLKPAQVTPLTSLKFCELVVMAGFPPGVVNVVPGSGTIVGQAIADHPLVRKLGFTGSTPIGQTIMESCAKSNLKKVSLELGGKSPLIIFDDADLEKAVRGALSAVFFNKGENCIAAGRIFIHDDIHDQFLARIVQEVGKMKIGDPLDRSTDHGPQNHLVHLEKLVEFCEIGVKEGAKLVLGGKRVARKGYFMEPTIFTDVEDGTFIAREESFGPVMIISRFRDLDEVIDRANNTEYGLASGVYTQNLSKAMQVVDRLQAGTVFVNTYNKTDVAAPFGGFKQSGFGKDLGEEALHEYLKIKTVTMEY